MDTDTKKQLIDMIRRTTPEAIAKEIAEVQPINSNTMELLLELASTQTEEELRAEGYEPVDPNGFSLLWSKKE